MSPRHPGNQRPRGRQRRHEPAAAPPRPRSWPPTPARPAPAARSGSRRCRVRRAHGRRARRAPSAARPPARRGLVRARARRRWPSARAARRRDPARARARSRVRSAFSVSACELHRDVLAGGHRHRARPPARRRRSSERRRGLALAAATPTTRLAVETMPSLAPSTAARSQPMRSVRWRSRCERGMECHPVMWAAVDRIEFTRRDRYADQRRRQRIATRRRRANTSDRREHQGDRIVVARPGPCERRDERPARLGDQHRRGHRTIDGAIVIATVELEGTVPRTIVITPLPAPYSNANDRKFQVESPAKPNSSTEAGNRPLRWRRRWGESRCPKTSRQAAQHLHRADQAPERGGLAQLKPLATIIASR